MIVANESDVQDQVAALLRSQGYAAEGVRSGAAALDWLRDNLPRLVLLDLLLPGGGGLDVLARLRSDARLSDIPVIVLTPPPSATEQRAWVEQRHADLIDGDPDSVLHAVREALAPRAEPVI